MEIASAFITMRLFVLSALCAGASGLVIGGAAVGGSATARSHRLQISMAEDVGVGRRELSMAEVGRRELLEVGVGRRELLASAFALPLCTLPLPALAATSSMAGKTVIVTGSNSGLGLEAATQLAGAGATVVLAVRDAKRGSAAADAIRATTNGAKVEVSQLELGDLASVKAFAKRWGDRPIDCLMLNAGVMAIPERSLTADGFERHWAVNHLGHFALTALLWPGVRKAAAAGGSPRVVVVSTDGHKKGKISFDDINLEQPGAYKDCNTPFCTAYTQSKLANVLFAAELERRIPAGLDVAVSSLSPGLVNTALFRYNVPALDANVATGSLGAPGELDKLLQVQGFFMTPTAKAAATQVALASDPALGRAAAGGKYFVDGKPAEPAKAATDPSTAAKLWELSERQAGVKFDPAA